MVPQSLEMLDLCSNQAQAKDSPLNLEEALMIKKLFVTFLSVVLSLLIPACVIPTNTNPAGYTAQLTAPNPGTVLFAGQSVLLNGNVTAPSGGSSFTSLSFYANGASIGSTTSITIDTEPDAIYGAGHTNWTAPSTPGEYQLQVMANLGNGRIVASNQVRVCVLYVTFQGIGNDASNPIEPYGYSGPCPPPTPPAFSITNHFVSIAAHASPDSLGFEARAGCPNSVPTPTITFTANVQDISDRAAFVIVNYALSTPSGTVGDQGPLILNQTSGSLPDRTFTGTTADLTPLLQGDSVDSSGNSIPGTITWTASAYDNSGALLATVGPYTISANPCVPLAVPPSHVIQPVPTETTAPGITINKAQAYPSPIYYGDACPNLAALTFSAALTFPQGANLKQVQVFAHANINSSAGGDIGNLLIPLLPNGTWDASTGGQNFTGTVALTHAYQDSNNHFDPGSLGGDTGSLHWYVVVSGRNSELNQSAEQIISLAPCPKYAKPTSPPSSGSSGNVCSGYTNPSACTTNGCSWDKLTSTCH